eukprot:6457277-Amphidinium_carterae.1
MPPARPQTISHQLNIPPVCFNNLAESGLLARFRSLSPIRRCPSHMDDTSRIAQICIILFSGCPSGMHVASIEPKSGIP